MVSPPVTWSFGAQHIGRRVWVYDSLPSTSDVAASLALDSMHFGTVILAEFQTEGRGQYGRVWQSVPGSSLLASVVLQPPAALRRPVILTAWAAVSLVRAIHELTGLQPRIKWPNDLLIDARKVCGILIEQSSAVVVGIGLNLNQSAGDFAQASLPDATSLAIVTGQRFDLRTVTAAVVRHLDTEYDQLIVGDPQSLEMEWTQRIGLVGQTVSVELADGTVLPGRLRALSFEALELDIGEVVPRVLQPELVRQIRQL